MLQIACYGTTIDTYAEGMDTNNTAYTSGDTDATRESGEIGLRVDTQPKIKFDNFRLLTASGAAVTSTQEGQSVSAIFFVLHLAPLYISWIFINDPHGPLAVSLSILPFTALMTTGMRNLFTIVPAWQIILSMAVQIACALAALWLAGRALRLGMLRYGQRLSLRGLLGTTSYQEKRI